MQHFKKNILYFIIGILFSLVIFLSLAAWNPHTGSTSSTVSICCNSSGQVVFVTDDDGVHKSSDGGKTWDIVLK